MTIVEALKAFYKNSVEDIKKLNDADSVLEVLRAKYGDYKGSNVAEYVQELVENNVSPGGGVTPTGTISITENGEGINVSSYAYADVNVSGGGGGDFPHLIVDTVQYTMSCDKTYEECTALLDGSEVEGEYPIIQYMGDAPLALGVMYDYTPDNYIRINIGVNIAYYLPDGTITTEQPQ